MSRSLFEYSALNWAHHSRLTALLAEERMLPRSIALCSNSHNLSWTYQYVKQHHRNQLRDLLEIKFLSNPLPIFLTSLLGLVCVTKFLLPNIGDALDQIAGDQGPLAAACLGYLNDHMKIARMMLDAGYELNVQDTRGRTPGIRNQVCECKACSAACGRRSRRQRV